MDLLAAAFPRRLPSARRSCRPKKHRQNVPAYCQVAGHVSSACLRGGSRQPYGTGGNAHILLDYPSSDQYWLGSERFASGRRVNIRSPSKGGPDLSITDIGGINYHEPSIPQTSSISGRSYSLDLGEGRDFSSKLLSRIGRLEARQHTAATLPAMNVHRRLLASAASISS